MKAGRDPHLPLHAVLEFFNGPQFLEFIRRFTGDRELAMVGAQATRYLPGQFLRMHDDRHDDENRRYAYVLNLSRDWQADWGGLLHFVDADGGAREAFLPRFNSLSLFKVPAQHFVGLVAPWAQQPRLAITGWWHAPPRT
jgi:Rps23 Pro-64 3,4-dihydroxylase Tpa1-like proline 4-hydroxylase